MERNRLARPFRRSMVLAIVVATPLVGGGLTLGADPVSLFVGGTAFAIVGSLLFGALVPWLPPLAFALVIVPTLLSGVAVFGWLASVIVSALAGGVALALFYRPTPPEPPRREASHAQRRDALGRPVYTAEPGRPPLPPDRVGDGRHH